jgi:uncharacterized coiled-coil DUF342 family protein
VEEILRAGYAEELHVYGQANEIAMGLAATLQRNQSVHQEMQAILGLLERVNAIEARMSPAKKEWLDSGKPNQEVRAQIATVASVVKQLVERIHATELEAQKMKDRLAPQLDDTIRGQQMRRAYGGTKAR